MTEEGRPKRQRHAVPRYDPDTEQNRAQWAGATTAAATAASPAADPMQPSTADAVWTTEELQRFVQEARTADPRHFKMDHELAEAITAATDKVRPGVRVTRAALELLTELASAPTAGGALAGVLQNLDEKHRRRAIVCMDRYAQRLAEQQGNKGHRDAAEQFRHILMKNQRARCRPHLYVRQAEHAVRRIREGKEPRKRWGKRPRKGMDEALQRLAGSEAGAWLARQAAGEEQEEAKRRKEATPAAPPPPFSPPTSGRPRQSSSSSSSSRASSRQKPRHKKTPGRLKAQRKVDGIFGTAVEAAMPTREHAGAQARDQAVAVAAAPGAARPAPTTAARAPVLEEAQGLRLHLADNSRNRSGYRGVVERGPGRFEASGTIGGRRIFVGSFDTASRPRVARQPTCAPVGITCFLAHIRLWRRRWHTRGRSRRRSERRWSQ